MVSTVDVNRIIGLKGGANQSGVRDHNERLLLSVLQQRGGMSGVDLARHTGLSPQTVSIILRKLTKDGLLKRGKPQRGKVGKPSIPMELDENGVFSLGLKVGRRSADLLLLDITGGVREQVHTTYDYAWPETIFGFVKNGLETILANMSIEARKRLCGIGIATPFELWKWHDLSGESAKKFQSWKDIDFAEEIRRFSELPVFVVNDATAACKAEHLFGRNKDYRDYAYFFIGSFIGGGIVINDTVFVGNQGNAGALGSMRTTSPLGESKQLVDVASIHLLEARLIEAGLDPDSLWQQPQDWDALSRYVEPWIGETAQELAKASLSICSVVDFEAIVIDGAFPTKIRDELVSRVQRYLAHQDIRGLIAPIVETGSMGENARGIGAASSPIFSQFLLNTNAGLAAS